MNKAETKFVKQKIVFYIFVAMILSVSSLQMLLLPKYSFDEYFTINLIRNSYAEVIRLTGLDVHPPLYYLVTKLCVSILGHNFVGWHMTSFACFYLLVVMTDGFVTRHFGSREAALCVLALCATPNMLRFCLQVRMYSMAMLFVTGYFLIILDLYLSHQKNGTIGWKQWLAPMIFGAAAAYTHYFAGVAVVGLALFMLGWYLLACKQNRKQIIVQWMLHCVGMAVLYLPWLFVMARQMQDINGNYWIRKFTATDLLRYLDMYIKMNTVWLQWGLAVLLVCGTLWLFVMGRDDKAHWKMGSFFATAFFFAFGIGYSVLRTPILIDRYVVIIVPMLWISVVLTLVEKRVKWLEVILIVFLCVCFVQNRNALYREYDAVDNKEETGCLVHNVQPGDVMYHTNVQRLAERAATVPGLVHLLKEGCDKNEAFHYWTEMIDCQVVADRDAVISYVDNQCPAGTAVWCEDDECAAYFEQAGFEITEYPAWSVVFYRMVKP